MGSTRPDGQDDTIGFGPEATAEAPRRRPNLLWLAGLAATALVLIAVGMVAGRMSAPTATPNQEAGLTIPGVSQFSGVPVPAPTARVPDGTDPGVGGCKADAQTLQSVPVMRQGGQIGYLNLKYSRRCSAGWAEIYLVPRLPIG
jgi:hypothetical protein